MEEYLKKDFGKILKSQGLEARRWMKNTDSDVCRVYDRLLEGLELTVDIYGPYARIMDYQDEARGDDEITEIIDIVSRFLYIERDKVIWKERKKREGREQHEKGTEECPVIVKENGLSFECELKKYVDTGLFLDMAENRRLLMEMSQNQRVLNIFSYTSSFSVYAAKGGAESVESVDLSNVYTAWSRRNLERNGFLDESKYKVVAEDARSFLERAVEEKRRYDIVIFDPPAFSNSHKAEDFDVKKDHVPFLAAIWKILSDDGIVLFSENLSGFGLDRNILNPWYEIKEITKEVTAMNFSTKRRSCRVWEMAKKPRKTRKDYNSGDRNKKMDEIKETEGAPERLVLNEEKSMEKGEKRVKAAPRAFSFDDYSEREEKKGGERRERSERRSDSYRGRDGERRNNRYSDNRGSSRYSDRRNDDRRSFGEVRRDDRRSERGSDRYSDRRNDRYSDRDSSRYNDRRNDRYSDRDSDRYSDRRNDRYSDRESRFNDRRNDRRDDRGYGREERSYSRYASDSRTSGGRRDRDGRRDNYKRDSYPSRDRRFSSDDWDNDTSRAYRSSRDEEKRGEYRREGRGRDEKKKSSPKPYGYDSFMENKNREGATAFWLQSQISDKNEDRD
ncbi:MAG: class I SAM-dependent methyltransferase [Spirochaetales bacterium]|nr:class I SAM-dependent methyltransferase [Spirochaetales bacterium]